MTGEYCEIVSADTADLFAFTEAGDRYVQHLEAIADHVSTTRARVVAAIGSSDAPVATTGGGGPNDSLAELIAEASSTNVFVAEIAAALTSFSFGGGSGIVPARHIDAVLAGSGLDLLGPDRSLTNDQTTLAVWAARRALQTLVAEAENGVPDHLRQNLVGQAIQDWLSQTDTSNPDHANVAALALLGEGIEHQAALVAAGHDDGSIDGVDGAVASLLVTHGLLLFDGNHGHLADNLAGRTVTTPAGERSALQVTVDALDLDQTNDYLNWHGLATSEAERTTQPWVRNNLLLQIVQATINHDGTINPTGQALVNDVLDRYPDVIELSADLWHDTTPGDRYHHTPNGAERTWSTEAVPAVLARALAAPNYGLTENEFEAAVALGALDDRLTAAGSDAQFHRLLAERFAAVDELAGGDPDLALLLDSAMAQGLSAAEALRLARHGAEVDSPNGTNARVRRIRLVYPTTTWGDPADPATAAKRWNLDRDWGDSSADRKALSLAVELGALQAIQAARFTEGKPRPQAPLTAEQLDLVRRYAEIEALVYHRYAWATGTQQAVIDLAAMDPDLRTNVLHGVPDGYDQLMADLAHPDNRIIWDYLAGADGNDSFLGPNGVFNTPGGDQWGGSNDAQALLGQLAIHTTIAPNHANLDFDGDGIIHEDEVDRWLEENDGRDGVPPGLVDQVRIGATIGLGQDTFGWEEFGEIVGWVGLAAAATTSIALTGGTAAPLWVKAGLVGLAATEAYAWHQASNDFNAALAGASIIADLAAAARLLRQARNMPTGPWTAEGIQNGDAHRAALVSLARQSDNQALRDLANTNVTLPNRVFFDQFETVLDTQSAALIQREVANGLPPAVAIAPFRSAGMDIARLERPLVDTAELGAVSDAPVRTITEPPDGVVPTRGLLDESDHIAIDDYTSNNYREINSYLRGGGRDTEMEARVRAIARAMERLPSYEGTVYRTTNLPGDVIIDMIRTGRFTDPGFFSTSMDLAEAQKFGGQVEFRIQSRTGRIVGDASMVPLEQEVLFGPGAEFSVSQIREVDDLLVVDMTEILRR